MIRYRDNRGRGRREPGKNLRGAPIGFTPELIGRILSLADALKAASAAAEKESVQLRPIRMTKVKPTVAIDVEPVTVETIAPSPAVVPVVVPGPSATRFTEVLSRLADAERATRSAPPSIAPRPRIGTPNQAKRIELVPHPMEQTAPAIAWLRSHGVSVSVASSGVHGSLWWVSGYPNAMGAADVIAVAERKGWEPRT